MSENIFLKALDRAVSVLTSAPENAGRPTRVAVQPQHESGNNIAAAVNRGEFGPPSRNAPMDKAVVRKALPPGALDTVPWPSPAQVKAFDEDLASEGYVRPKEAYAALEKLNEPFNRLGAAIATVTRSQHPAYMAHVADIARRTAEGDTTVQTQDAWTKSDFEEDARERLTAFKAELRKIETRAWAIAEPVLLEKSAYATARADVLDDIARQPYDLYKVAYQAPGYILILRKYAASLANGSRRTAGLPTAMLATL